MYIRTVYAATASVAIHVSNKERRNSKQEKKKKKTRPFIPCIFLSVLFAKRSRTTKTDQMRSDSFSLTSDIRHTNVPRVRIDWFLFKFILVFLHA